MNENEVMPIRNLIYEIRAQRVMLDSDLAGLYGVEAKRLNEAVKRNIERFPSDFMFQLSKDEFSKVVANCDHLQRLKYLFRSWKIVKYRIRRAIFSPMLYFPGSDKSN